MANVLRPKVHDLFYVSNQDLRIKDKSGKIIPGGHVVIVTNVDKKKKKVKVKTITSVNKLNRKTNQLIYDLKTLDAVHNGDALVISRKDLKSPYLSAVVHKKIEINQKALKPNGTLMRFPKRYVKLIDRK